MYSIANKKKRPTNRTLLPGKGNLDKAYPANNVTMIRIKSEPPVTIKLLIKFCPKGVLKMAL